MFSFRGLNQNYDNSRSIKIVMIWMLDNIKAVPLFLEVYYIIANIVTLLAVIVVKL